MDGVETPFEVLECGAERAVARDVGQQSIENASYQALERFLLAWLGYSKRESTSREGMRE